VDDLNLNNLAASLSLPPFNPYWWGGQYRLSGQKEWKSTLDMLGRPRKARYRSQRPAEADLEKAMDDTRKYGVEDGRLVAWSEDLTEMQVVDERWTAS
jgi:hypothetical protein